MTALAHMRGDQAWVSVSGVDVKRAFQGRFLTNTGVLLPTNIHQLPDFRPASEQALEDALVGLPPFDTKLPRFDPLQGPFSLDVVASCAWAQSLEFLRDIKAASIGDTKLPSAWVTTWLVYYGTNPEKPTGLFAHGQESNTKTQRLIWRARRVLNCLSHVLPILPQLPPQVTAAFWRSLITDIAKLCTPTETVWAHLKDGFDVLSPRAMWLRGVAILGVEAAFPGFLREEQLEKSLETIHSTLQDDGMMAGGSILGTLSAGADLCMLARIRGIEHSLQKIRTALASLRHKDGTLVTFGSGNPDYRHLVAAVLGPGDWKPSALLLGSGIARLSVKETVVWMRAQQSDFAHGPVCEVEVGGCALITSASGTYSAIGYAAPTQVTQSRCKRRDEPDCSILEATATFNAAGGSFIGSRQIRVAHDATRINGEDSVRPQGSGHSEIVTEICFAIPGTCSWSISKDQNSVLIVTSQQQAWRFRAEGMDIRVEMRSGASYAEHMTSGPCVIVCHYPSIQKTRDFRAVWQFVTEDLK